MSYRREFGKGWVYVLAATIGMSVGLALNHYTLSLFARHLLAEFGWSKAQFALIGSTPFITMFFAPFLGRFADQVGPRNAALLGFLVLPLGHLGVSMMTGSFAVFYALTIVKAVFGGLTATTVFARVIVERFDKARGLALSVIMTGPPLMGALATPVIAIIIEHYGWRAGFQALAAFTATFGLITVALLSRRKPAPTPLARPAYPLDEASTEVPPVTKFSLREALKIFSAPVFLVSIGGMMLVNSTQVLAASQLTLVLQDSGATAALATALVAFYAVGVAVGRIASGLALDRIPLHKVAIATLGLPAIGLCAMASPFDAPWVLSFAVLLMGLAQGAEGDIGAYLISRRVGLENYSLAMSLMGIAMTVGGATGALVLSATLKLTGDYNTFLVIAAVATVIGALMFYSTGRNAGSGGEPAPARA